MRFVAFTSLVLAGSAYAQLMPPRLATNPDIFGDKVVFCAEGDLWLGDLTAGSATRITTWPGIEDRPRFSPDGKQVCFTGTYDSRRDVYVMDINGGQPVRWTFDPAGADSVDWAPDGKSLLIRTARDEAFRDRRLWTLSAPGAMPLPLPMGKAGTGTYLGNANQLVFTPFTERSNNWKQYHGGMQNDLWLADLAASRFTRITNNEVDETSPVSCGGKVYYVSEQSGPANLYRVDPATKKTEKVTNFTDAGMDMPGADSKRVVFVYRGNLEIYDPAKQAVTIPKLEIKTDRIYERPHEVKGELADYAVGPSGKRVLVQGRGQIFTAPATAGDIRPVATLYGSDNKMPRWSPDASKISFISDRSDEWNIWLQDAAGAEPPQQLTQLKGMPIQSYRWSPNGAYILMLTFDGALSMVDVKTGTTTKIAQDNNDSLSSYDISLTGRFIAYAMTTTFNTSWAFIYDTLDKKTYPITSGSVNDSAVAFDRNGKLLYVMGNRHVTQEFDSFDFQMNAGPAGRIMAFALTSDFASPFNEKIDEEPVGGKATETPVNPMISYDLTGASQRMIWLPTAPGERTNLQGGKDGVYWLEDGNLMFFSMNAKKAMTIADGAASYSLSYKADKVCVRTGADRLVVGDAGGPVGGESVPLRGWTVHVEPVKEWRESLREGWRFIRDTFYDPKLHGADWNKVWQDIEAMIPAIGSRADVNQIVGRMQAEVNVSHMFNGGGYNRFNQPNTPVGMGYLGCRYHYAEGVLIVDKVYRGDGFDDATPSPLAAPGIDIRDGDIIFSINGVTLNPTVDPQQLLVNSGGQLVKLETGHTRALDQMRTVWVRALTRENDLIYQDWSTSRREYVTAHGGPNLAYVHVPDMGSTGMTEFTKQFYASLEKDGIIVDVRHNSGGITSGMVLERLRRVIFEYDQARYGNPVPYHRMGTTFKIVALCDEDTSSDGEYFCTGFKALKLGPVIGMRTWGGFVAVGGTTTVDGGFVSCPQMGSFSPNGEWLPDGTGFKPDIVVEQDPNLLLKGLDPQLDKGIEVLKELIRKDPPQRGTRKTPPVKPPIHD